MGDYSTKELMACWLSRDLNDGEKVGVGANFHVPRAAVLLAHFSHCPNMKMGMGSFMANLMNVDRVMTPRYLTDFRPVQWAESALYMPLDLMGFHTLDVFFISGIQVDAYGNTNLIGIPGEGGKFKFRGPGSIGTSTLAAVAGRYYIVTDHHTPRVFVERCSVISALGFGDGSAGLRQKLKLPGNGPKYCITPLCVFDFAPDGNRMRIRSLHPGITLEQVMDNMGFEPEVIDGLEETEPPAARELEMLRQRVDPEGLLRGGGG
jgi:glutaconate CoA-transferase subunit B